MADKDTVMETEEKEVESPKISLSRRLTKDLAEGVYNHVQNPFPTGAKRLFAHRTCQVHITELRPGTEVRRKVQPAF